MTPLQVAQICHAANSELRRQLGEPVVEWHEYDPLRQAALATAVENIAQKRWLSPQEMHSEWVISMVAQGWSYGPILDDIGKRHPNMLPYCELAPEQRLKDTMFGAIARALL